MRMVKYNLLNCIRAVNIVTRYASTVIFSLLMSKRLYHLIEKGYVL